MLTLTVQKWRNIPCLSCISVVVNRVVYHYWITYICVRLVRILNFLLWKFLNSLEKSRLVWWSPTPTTHDLALIVINTYSLSLSFPCYLNVKKPPLVDVSDFLDLSDSFFWYCLYHSFVPFSFFILEWDPKLSWTQLNIFGENIHSDFGT